MFRNMGKPSDIWYEAVEIHFEYVCGFLIYFMSPSWLNTCWFFLVGIVNEDEFRVSISILGRFRYYVVRILHVSLFRSVTNKRIYRIYIDAFILFMLKKKLFMEVQNVSKQYCLHTTLRVYYHMFLEWILNMKIRTAIRI